MTLSAPLLTIFSNKPAIVHTNALCPISILFVATTTVNAYPPASCSPIDHHSMPTTTYSHRNTPLTNSSHKPLKKRNVPLPTHIPPPPHRQLKRKPTIPDDQTQPINSQPHIPSPLAPLNNSKKTNVGLPPLRHLQRQQLALPPLLPLALRLLPLHQRVWGTGADSFFPCARGGGCSSCYFDVVVYVEGAGE